MIHYGCENVPGWDTSKCCISCHEDYEEFGYDLCSAEFQGNNYEEICCAAWIYIEELIKTKDEDLKNESH